MLIEQGLAHSVYQAVFELNSKRNCSQTPQAFLTAALE